MTGEEMKLLAKRFFEEALNQKHYEVLDDLIADDYVEHEEFPGSPPGGKASVRYYLETIHTGFPDLTGTIEDIAAEGDRLWVRYRMRGSHKGDFAGIPATGRSIDLEGVDVVRVRNGKAVEHWGYQDNLNLMQQLGVIPEDPIA